MVDNPLLYYRGAEDLGFTKQEEDRAPLATYLKPSLPLIFGGVEPSTAPASVMPTGTPSSPQASTSGTTQALQDLLFPTASQTADAGGNPMATLLAQQVLGSGGNGILGGALQQFGIPNPATVLTDAFKGNVLSPIMDALGFGGPATLATSATPMGGTTIAGASGLTPWGGIATPATTATSATPATGLLGGAGVSTAASAALPFATIGLPAAFFAARAMMTDSSKYPAVSVGFGKSGEDLGVAGMNADVAPIQTQQGISDYWNTLLNTAIGEDTVTDAVRGGIHVIGEGSGRRSEGMSATGPGNYLVSTIGTPDAIYQSPADAADAFLQGQYASGAIQGDYSRKRLDAALQEVGDLYDFTYDRYDQGMREYAAERAALDQPQNAAVFRQAVSNPSGNPFLDRYYSQLPKTGDIMQLMSGFRS